MLVPDLACDVEGLLSETNMKMIEALPIEQLVVSLPFAALRRARRPRPLLAAALGSGPRVLASHASSPPQITNTVPQKQHEAACSKIVTLDVSPTIAESIRRTHNGESISLLFGDWAEGAGVNGVGVY